MFSSGQPLCTSKQKEEKVINVETLLVNLLQDHVFVDYFNVFLNLPVFGQRMLMKLHERRFILDPPVSRTVKNDKVMTWMAARRFYLFSKTDLYLEYQLCHELRDIDFELRFKNKDLDPRTQHVVQIFANNLLGSVAGMYLFREHLRDTAGSNVYKCWLHVQRFRQTHSPEKRREIFQEIQQRYLNATGVHKLSNRLCRVVIFELLKIPVLPDTKPALSGQLESSCYLPLSETDLLSRDALVHVHHVLLDALRSYWVPRYVMHVLATQPFSVLKELCGTPAGNLNLDASELESLIRNGPLVSIPRSASSDSKHDDNQTESDTSSLTTISPSSSMTSLTLSSVASVSTVAQITPSKSCSYLESCQDLHLPSRPSSFTCLATEGPEACPQLLTLGESTVFDHKGKTEDGTCKRRDYTGSKELISGFWVAKDRECDCHHHAENDDDNPKTCPDRSFIGDERTCSEPASFPTNERLCLKLESPRSPRQHSGVWDAMRANPHRSKRTDFEETSEKVNIKKASRDYKEDDKENNVWNAASILNLTRLALKEMVLKPEPMTYISQLLQHYIFGYRYLDKERPVTDRRTLCLLACDELAGCPFRSYLQGSDQKLHLSYFDFWSAMRRYQQLQDLHRMSDIIHSESGPTIASLHRQVRYVADRFLLGSGLDANILEYKTRLKVFEDMREGRWSPLINSILDVVSNILRVAMKQFILHDRLTFLKAVLEPSSSQVELRQDASSTDSPESISDLMASPTFVDRRSLSDPWKDDPQQDPEGDMESLRPTDPDSRQHEGVVGVLGEQHRLLAFQFLIILREDLRTSRLCDMGSLAQMVHSEYGSLHMSFIPVTDSKDKENVDGREKDETGHESAKGKQRERFLKVVNKPRLNRFRPRELKPFQPQKKDVSPKLKDRNASERYYEDEDVKEEEKDDELRDESDDKEEEEIDGVTDGEELKEFEELVTSSPKNEKTSSIKGKGEKRPSSFEQGKEEKSKKNSWLQEKRVQSTKRTIKKKNKEDLKEAVDENMEDEIESQTRSEEFEEKKCRPHHAEEDVGGDESAEEGDKTVKSHGGAQRGQKRVHGTMEKTTQKKMKEKNVKMKEKVRCYPRKSKEDPVKKSLRGLTSLEENADSTISAKRIVPIDLPTKTVDEPKSIGLWRDMLLWIQSFMQSLSNPDERRLFEVFLNLEIRKSKINGDKVLSYIDREGFQHKMYMRRALTNLLICVNKLPSDLRFFVEAHRFQKQVRFHLSSTEGGATDKRNPMLAMRANAIIECFFKSVCEPMIQVNCCRDKAVSGMIADLQSKGVSMGLFHDVYIQLFPLLYRMWKEFSQEWLSRLRGPNRRELFAELLSSYKNPIIGEVPHPDTTSAHYLHLTFSDFHFCSGSEKDLKGGVGSVLKFTLQHGVRVLHPETKEKNGQLPESGADKNNSDSQEKYKDVERRDLFPTPLK